MRFKVGEKVRVRPDITNEELRRVDLCGYAQRLAGLEGIIVECRPNGVYGKQYHIDFLHTWWWLTEDMLEIPPIVRFLEALCIK